jgi:hypothetical protein
MADLTGMMQAAAGAAGGGGEYIEDVFSTYLYTGTGATQTITNGIDLDGEGGLVWLKNRPFAANHLFIDTERGSNKQLRSNETGGNETNATILTSFNSSGFTLGVGNSNSNNTGSGETYVSWTFRQAEKFFDVVTYTGNGANRTISHNLGSVPGCIIVKRTDTTGDWQVYHRANTANPETDYLVLNSTAATADSDTRWNDTQPTDAVFSLGTEATVNANGGTYVAYLWAHDAGGFGDDGLQNVVTCGSYTGNGSATGPVVTLNYEPQWLIVKRSAAPSGSGTAGWVISDNMRGLSQTQDGVLSANTSGAETAGSVFVQANATGFQIATTNPNWNTSGDTYIYIAIRRGPMKTPTAGTEVFGLNARTGTGADATVTGSAGVSDAVLIKNRGSAVASLFAARLTATNYLVTSTTAAQVAAATTILQANPWDVMDGVKVGTDSTITNASANTFINYLFRRAPGFFDVVCYTGTGANRTVAHNLAAVPELMIVKKRSATDDWGVYAGDNTDFLLLNTTAATADDNTYWNDTSPTSTVFSVGTNADVNTSAATYVAYLFASLAGVSKVGTYTGNGSSVTVTTGFQPRFILVKRTDSTGNWIVGDSARGLPAGDDPFFLLNTDAAETTNQDWVDVSATGFTVNETAANANVNTGTYIYLAIS